MKILVLSDLHLEFVAFEPDQDAVRAADVVVLAGDIHMGVDGILWACKTFVDKPVVYVAGNHEFYGGDWDETLDQMRETAKVNDVYFLEDACVTIAGVRFLGCTLWTDFEYFGQYVIGKLMYEAEHNFSDYTAINYLLPTNRLTARATLRRHQASRAWLEAELPKGDPAHTVVVTHHYPHKNSTAPKYAGNALTAIFGSHLPEGLLLQAGLWIHGHTHGSSDYRVDGEIHGVKRYVRVICNPRGYPRGFIPGDLENQNFNPGLLVTQLPDGNWAEFYEV